MYKLDRSLYVNLCVAEYFWPLTCFVALAFIHFFYIVICHTLFSKSEYVIFRGKPTYEVVNAVKSGTTSCTGSRLLHQQRASTLSRSKCLQNRFWWCAHHFLSHFFYLSCYDLSKLFTLSISSFRKETLDFHVSVWWKIVEMEEVTAQIWHLLPLNI